MKQGEAQYLAGRLGQLEIDKAILLNELAEVRKELDTLKEKEVELDGDNRES